MKPKNRRFFTQAWGPLDRSLLILAVLANVLAALDFGGLSNYFAPDAPTRALSEFRHAKKLEPAMNLRRDALISELQAGHPWAGKYHALFGQELSVGPGLGYRMKWTNYLGEAVFDHGELRDQPSRLVLRSARRFMEPFGYRIVRWGGRVYLIEDDKLLDFANAVNKGQEPRASEDGDYFLREGDWSKPAPGRPLAQGLDRAYFLTAPVGARIMKTGTPRREGPEWDTRLLQRVVLNAGRDKGLMPGMRIYPRRKEILSDFEILSSSKNSSVAGVRIESWAPAPRTGWKLSTRDERPPLDLTGMGFCGTGLLQSFHDWELPNGYGLKDEE